MANINAKQAGVIHLGRSGFDFYGTSMPTIIKGFFTPEAVVDLEVINYDQLLAQVRSFVETNKIPPTDITLLLSEEILFIKDFLKEPLKPVQPAPNPQTAAPQQPAPITPPQQAVDSGAEQESPSELAQKFIENTPFEDVGSKIITLPNGVRVIATNQALYDAVKKAFETVGSIIEVVVPIVVYGNTINLTSGFTPQVATTILHRADIARQNNFLIKPKPVESTEKNDGKLTLTNEKANPKTIAILGSVFGILLIVMITMYYTLYIAPAKKKKLPVTPMPAPVAVSPTITSSATSSSSAVLTNETVTIQLLRPASAAKEVTTLQTTLEKAGFTKTTVQTNTSTVTKSLIVMSSKVPAPLQQQLVAEVKKLYPQISSQIGENANADIVITLAN